MKISGIYIIKNASDGKVYVGSAKDFRVRWRIHRFHLNKNTHHAPHLQHAWNKYGSTNFEFSIVEEVPDITKLIEREQFWIDSYRSYLHENGYNVSPTAGSSFGVKRSLETRAKLSKISTENASQRFTPEVREQISKGVNAANPSRMRGRKHSESTKLLMSLVHSGKKKTAEHIRNAANARIGTKWSQESRNRQSIAQKLRFQKLREHNNVSSASTDSSVHR